MFPCLLVVEQNQTKLCKYRYDNSIYQYGLRLLLELWSLPLLQNLGQLLWCKWFCNWLPLIREIADIQSKYIQQLRELHAQFEMGALTDKEFTDQKLSILDPLKKFKPWVTFSFWHFIIYLHTKWIITGTLCDECMHYNHFLLLHYKKSCMIVSSVVVAFTTASFDFKMPCKAFVSRLQY